MRSVHKYILLLLALGVCAKTTPSKSKDIRILCLGDSLTAGYIGPSQQYHPYTLATKNHIRKTFPEANVTLSNEGLPGDQVQSPPGQFLTRINKIYNEGQQFDFAIVLGGTNDLGQGREAIPIYQALEKVWNVAIEHDTKVLALTVTDSANTPEPVNIRRSVLNAQILAHEQKDFFKLDLSSMVPYFAMPEEKRKDIWSDGLHFTAKGYDLVGKIIADRVIQLLAEKERENVHADQEL